MGVFRFSLEKVRCYRQAVEDKLKQELAGVLRERDREEALLGNITREQAARQATKYTGSLTVTEAIQSSLYLEQLASRRRLQEERVNAAVERVKRQQGEVMEAMRDRKVLDRLRQRQAEAYQYDLARREQKEVDEAAVIGYNRSSMRF